jgi:hypothetical protein
MVICTLVLCVVLLLASAVERPVKQEHSETD